jgi:hypothetical protein
MCDIDTLEQHGTSGLPPGLQLPGRKLQKGPRKQLSMCVIVCVQYPIFC